jgi:hypothetical protein
MKRVRFSDKIQIKYVDKIDADINKEYNTINSEKKNTGGKVITVLVLFLVILIILALLIN